MARLGELADEQTPLLADLERAAPDLNTFFTRLGPFSEASPPGRPVARRRWARSGTKAFNEGKQEVAELNEARGERAAASPSRCASSSRPLDDRNRAIETTRARRTPRRPRPTRPPSSGERRLHRLRGDLELLLLADAQHQHAGRHRATSCARRSTADPQCMQFDQPQAGPGDDRQVQLVPGSVPARHHAARPARRRLEPVGSERPRQRRQAGRPARASAAARACPRPARCPASRTSRSRTSCCRRTCSACSTRSPAASGSG